MRKAQTFIRIAISVVAALLLGTEAFSAGPVPLIIDTDMSYDVDDVLAVCAAHAMAQNGEADILAIVHNVGIPIGVGGISVINHYYGRDDIPIGGYKGPFGRDSSGNWVLGKYLEDIVSRYPSPIKNLTQVDDAVTVYRRVLAAADDHTVSIASIGFLMNLLDLLKSPADSVSPMNGTELVAAKVRRVTFMGGWWPPLHPLGHETYNFNCARGVYASTGCEGSTAAALALMPASVSLVFSDLGDDAFSGAVLTSAANESNPCRQALMDQQGPNNGRCDWDPIVTLAAVRGVQAVWAETQGTGGHISVDEQGANNWVPGTSSNQSYINFNGPDWGMMRAAVGGQIDGLLLQPPG